MTLKFRLRGLAETFLDEISCPACSAHGTDETAFSTELTRVTYEGIIVVVQCKGCGEIFVPREQRLGVINPSALRDAVEKDANDLGETVLTGLSSVRLNAEKLNAQRKGELH